MFVDSRPNYLWLAKNALILLMSKMVWNKSPKQDDFNAENPA